MTERVSDRKLRLFATACCYLTLRGKRNEDAEARFESVVRFADGSGTLEEMKRLSGPRGANSVSGRKCRSRGLATSLRFPSDKNPGIFRTFRLLRVVLLLHDIFGESIPQGEVQQEVAY